MQLDRLHVLNFKNWEERELAFREGINCLVGPNGQGKTNLLDAIYYLCFTKSFLNTADSQNIRLEEPFFMLEGWFTNSGQEDHVQVSVKRGQKKQVRRNKKEYEKLADHIGQFPAVMVCPQNASIITGSSEERRRWLDALISQFDPVYLQQLINYYRVLGQRNSLIKQLYENRTWDETTMLVYDEQLSKYGEDVYNRRKQFIEVFVPVFHTIYADISNNTETVNLQLQSGLDKGSGMMQILLQSRTKDRALQYTSAGIHKDDLEFSIQKMAIKKFGSQGQQKTFLMALKLAEHAYLKQVLHHAPLLLLDDIFDKLDNNRVSRLIRRVSESGYGQVFITDTGREKLEQLFNSLGVSVAFYEI